MTAPAGDQSGYLRALERLADRVRSGELVVVSHQAFGAAGDTVVTFRCRRGAPAPAGSAALANIRVETYTQDPDGVWTITATNLRTGATVTIQGRGARGLAEREAIDAVRGQAPA